MDDAAEVAALRDCLKKPNATDLFVISHGWNNDMSDARKLYAKFLAACGTCSTGSPSRGLPAFLRRLAVLWPSMKFADEDLIPSGAAGSAPRAPIRPRQPARQARRRPSAPQGRQDRGGRALVPRLANRSEGRARYSPTSCGPRFRRRRDGRADASKAVFQDRKELFTACMQFCLLKPAATPAAAAGGAAVRRPHRQRPAAGPPVWRLARGSAARANRLNYATYYQMKDTGRDGRPRRCLRPFAATEECARRAAGAASICSATASAAGW